ncbi:hypothetical protein COY52_12575 [Candidatus Desantisbacteria bacterium CG_4_10_14_0_8_um_filter_48_22]|uniref:Lipoprotein-releasing system transmembrane subunit LolC n=1 Tax=Candidatus Desantisbacteria bacterium CG_4_10_14_0_8_um_filter_48_22 TaxID=1974543 RepID=A0A2M7S5D0_9BACT|nr:MAG: hypothetical protein COS16_09725 [Candidatus Desantisbacteria bacterium CG02_land_8_20_14_3_00_49_13]PIZ14463.1 MAG: hypothetical protein COY52_12575 [Candidatus Desantisbacteria bacterium CG_4_10_14_0_8_um_filter_48_22]
MKASWMIAWKHLRKKKGFFLNLSTFLSIAGIVVGVMALDITLAVMSGFNTDLKDKILGMQPHVLVFNDNAPLKYAKTMDRIALYFMINKLQLKKGGEDLKMTAIAAGQGIIRSGRTMSGVEIKGIDPKTEAEVTNFPSSMKEGKFLLESGEALLGKELARNLGLKTGDECYLVSGFSADMAKFRISGIFATGLYAYDSGIACISLKDAQKIFGLKADEATVIGIKTKDIYRAGKIAALIQGELKYPFVVRSWDQMNRNLFATLKLEKTVMFILLSLIILVAGFGMANTMIMNVMKKVKEIGIIQTLGANPAMIRKIFLVEGSVSGLIGISIGSALGLVACLLLKKYEFIKLPGEFYYMSYLPVQMRPADFLWVAVMAFAIVVIFSIYPAFVASRIRPAEAMRQEQ